MSKFLKFQLICPCDPPNLPNVILEIITLCDLFQLKSVIKELKTNPGHENDCGRQGVNGGYIDNQYIKFGVNCFGEKPEQTDKDKAYIEILKHSHSPALDHTNYDKTDNKLISPFNNDKWSMI